MHCASRGCWCGGTPCTVARSQGRTACGRGSKAGSTLRSSRAVPHPSTNRALRRLTSEVGRDPVHSTRYGRQRHMSEMSSWRFINGTESCQLPSLPGAGVVGVRLGSCAGEVGHTHSVAVGVFVLGALVPPKVVGVWARRVVGVPSLFHTRSPHPRMASPGLSREVGFNSSCAPGSHTDDPEWCGVGWTSGWSRRQPTNTNQQRDLAHNRSQPTETNQH